MLTIEQAADELAAGRITARALVEESLARVALQPAAFMAVQAEAARAAADAQDALRRAGRAGRHAGIPVTVKDLFDQAGVVTRAGSLALGDAAPAAADAPVVARLQAAGFVVLGRTGMVEFAFSGLGVNPHFGTPLNPWDRATGRLPGGSSSGAAVAAADGMGFGGLGSDTGGSCRIPAALCGVVGYKPTAARVPLAGAQPLSFTLDSIGPIARSVACCRVLDGVIADQPAPHAPLPLAGLRLAVLRNLVEEEMEDAVARPYSAALSKLSAAGARLSDLVLPEIAELPGVNASGGFSASEAWAWHKPLIERAEARYDPRILARIRRGERMTAENYITLLQARRAMIARVAARVAGFDAILLPTVPLAPPALAAVADERGYNRINMLLLRNTSIANFLDGCAISLPCHLAGEAPAGLMLMAMGGADARLLAVAQAVEAALA